MATRTPKFDRWITTEFVGAADLNKAPAGWVEGPGAGGGTGTIAQVDTVGPGSASLISSTFSARNGRSYLVHVACAPVFLFAGVATSYVTLNLFIGGVLVRNPAMRLTAVGDAYFAPIISHMWNATATATVAITLDQVVSGASTARHDGGTRPGQWIVTDIGPSS